MCARNTSKGKTMEIVKISVVARSSGEGMNKGRIEDFWDSENTLYDTRMVDTCFYPFVPIHRMHNIKSEP